MKRVYVLLILMSLVFSCKPKNKLDVNVSKIDVSVKVKRFEQVFYTAKPSDLPKIKKEFRSIFPHDIDSIWLKKMVNPQELELYNEVQNVYPDFKNEKKQLITLFKHIKYYYPKFTVPKIITVISNIPLEQKVILDANTLYISLDVFLGAKNSFYHDYPQYIKQNLTKEQLIVAVAKVFAQETQFHKLYRTFISRMIQKGKLLYTVTAFLPKMKPHKIMGYSTEQLRWNSENEEMIWRYFIEKKLLNSTDPKLDRRFMEDAPFSKFYLDIDNKSPGRVGEWLGLQIVNSFMKNNDVSLKELLKMDNEEIFKKSKYKPKRN